jgi:steroid 5-alpha reductase family enzyme
VENVFLNVYLTNLAFAMAYVTGIWLLSLKLKDASIMDIFWGPGFVLVAWVTYFVTSGFCGRKLLVVVL